MTTFELYQDEDAQDADLVTTLGIARIAVHSSGLLGMNGSTDEEQLAFASAQGWVIYTSNTRDFAVLHRDWLAQGRSHAGIIYRTRQQWSVGEQARRIRRIWETLSAEDMVDRYESLSQWGEDRP